MCKVVTALTSGLNKGEANNALARAVFFNGLNLRSFCNRRLEHGLPRTRCRESQRARERDWERLTGSLVACWLGTI
jgi:hypothetical protein